MKKIKLGFVIIIGLFTSKIQAQEPHFTFNGGADVIFSYPPRGSGGRSLVHDVDNKLTLNFGGDFTGGVKIGPHIQLFNDGAIRIPDGSPFSCSNITTTDYSTMSFMSRAWETVQGKNGKAFSFQTHNNSGNGGFEMMAIYYGESGKIILAPNGGDVGIGTNDPQGYKLAVKGKIRSQEIKVEASHWPDYVFAQGYKHPTLEEIKKHILDKGHLPEVPTAKEVKDNGIELGNMNAMLLKKIEELTLHLIEINGRLQTLEKENQLLKKSSK